VLGFTPTLGQSGVATIEGFFLGTLWIFGLDPSSSWPWVKGFKYIKFP